MRAVAGSIISLTGGIIIAAGIVGEGLCQAAGRFPGQPTTLGLIGGVVVAFVGLAITAWGLAVPERLS